MQHDEISPFLGHSLAQGTCLRQPHHSFILQCLHSCPKAQQCYVSVQIISLLPNASYHLCLPPASYLSFTKCLHFLSFNKSDFHIPRVFPLFFPMLVDGTEVFASLFLRDHLESIHTHQSLKTKNNPVPFTVH